MKRLSLVLGLVVLVILVGLSYLYGGHQTPSGQPALAELNSASLDGLKNEFNSSHADVRLLVLLSPT